MQAIDRREARSRRSDSGAGCPSGSRFALRRRSSDEWAHPPRQGSRASAAPAARRRRSRRRPPAGAPQAVGGRDGLAGRSPRHRWSPGLASPRRPIGLFHPGRRRGPAARLSALGRVCPSAAWRAKRCRQMDGARRGQALPPARRQPVPGQRVGRACARRRRTPAVGRAIALRPEVRVSDARSAVSADGSTTLWVSGHPRLRAGADAMGHPRPRSWPSVAPRWPPPRFG